MDNTNEESVDRTSNTSKLDTVVIKPCYYVKRYYHAWGLEKDNYNFYIEIYDIDTNLINDHPLADYAYNQTWAKTRSQMNKAEKKCLKAGLIRIY